MSEQTKTRRENELGAVWKKESNGRKYYWGKIVVEGVEVPFVMFKNEKKIPGSNQPDIGIFYEKSKMNQLYLGIICGI